MVGMLALERCYAVRIGGGGGGNQEQIILLIFLIVNRPMFIEAHGPLGQRLPGSRITDIDQAIAGDVLLDEGDVGNEQKHARRLCFSWNSGFYEIRAGIAQWSEGGILGNAV